MHNINVFVFVCGSVSEFVVGDFHIGNGGHFTIIDAKIKQFTKIQ